MLDKNIFQNSNVHVSTMVIVKMALPVCGFVKRHSIVFAHLVALPTSRASTENRGMIM